MAKTAEIVRQKSLEILLVVLAGAVAYLLTIVWTELSVPFAEKVLPTLSNKSLLSIITIQFGLLVAAAFWLRVLYRRLSKALSAPKPDPLSNFEFAKRLGIYRHRQSGLYYCTSCLQTGTESPLKESSSGWQCEVKTCEKFYRNPDYKDPKPFHVERRSHWMDGF